MKSKEYVKLRSPPTEELEVEEKSKERGAMHEKRERLAQRVRKNKERKERDSRLHR